MPFSLPHFRARALAAAASALVALAACGGDDDPVKPTGPVTLKFETLALRGVGNTLDTIFGIAILDGRDTIRIPNESFFGVSRGEHDLSFRFDNDYLSYTVRQNIDPNTANLSLNVAPLSTCRTYATDDACFQRNLLYYAQSRRILCPANDYGEFCLSTADRQGVGATWPNDTNQYVSRGKLLIAATLGAGSPFSGTQMATAFTAPGDYAPRTRLTITPGDSSRYSNEVWTDARHTPVFPAQVYPLGPGDREAQNFGLAVQTTYHLPPQYGDALFIRYDIRNISNEPRFRIVNPEEPVGGHTLTNIFLVPMIDADIGGLANNEFADDNATVFAADSLIVAYDQAFSVPNFSLASRLNPGLVGLQLVAGPAGTTARALIVDGADSLSFASAVLERATHTLLAAGRAGSAPGCADRGIAFVCVGDSPTDVRAGWSIGPIPSLAPGQSTSITVALIFANPRAGSFTGGTQVSPSHGTLGASDSANPLFNIAEPLRALSAQIRRVTVTPVPPAAR